MRNWRERTFIWSRSPSTCKEERPAPWIRQAKATYTALVDPLNRLGQLFQFNFVPLTILIDENGQVVHPPRSTDIRRQGDRQIISQWLRTGSLESSGSPPAASTTSAAQADLHFQAAAALVAEGKTEPALRLLQKALAQDPDNWLIRKQIWAIEQPERFYQGPIDTEWQKQRLERERPSP